MNLKEEHYIDDFQDYVELLKQITNNGQKSLWFRGQESSEYGLTPGLLRPGYVYSVCDKFGNKIDPPKQANLRNPDATAVVSINQWDLVDEFKQDIKHSNARYLQPDNDLEYLELAQHYGLPTKILDWSTDPLIGLFFAVSTIPDNRNKNNAINDSSQKQYDSLDSYASVWIIDPLEINRVNKIDKVLQSDCDSDQIIKLSKKDCGIWCFEGSKINPRICRQSGNFTISSEILPWDLDFMDIYRPSIIKINIPYSSVKGLQNTLNALNLNNESIYYGKTDLDSISKQVSNKYINTWLTNINCK